MKKNFLKVFSLMSSGLFLLFNTCWADGPRVEKAQLKRLQAIEFLSGFARAKLHGKGNYTMSPFIVALDFDLKPLIKKIGFNPPVLFLFQLEPFISPVYEPDANVEIGNAFALKVGIFPQDLKFQPYIKVAPGIVYITQHTREQSTQFNFFEYAGVGMHYFFRKNIAFTIEYRYRHLSNSSIKHPNHGINTQFALLGMAYQF